MPDLRLTPRNIYLAFAEFLKTWLNVICYERQLYPHETFTVGLTDSFGIVVPASRNDKVIQWQEKFIDQVLEVLLSQQLMGTSSSSTKVSVNRIKSISLVIFESDGKPLEKHVCDVSYMQIVHTDDLDTMLNTGISWESVHESCRSMLYELLSVVRKAPAIKIGSEFEVFIETDEVSQLEGDWILYNKLQTTNNKSGEQNAQETSGSNKSDGGNITIVNSIDLDPLNFHCYTQRFS